MQFSISAVSRPDVKLKFDETIVWFFFNHSVPGKRKIISSLRFKKGSVKWKEPVCAEGS
jgi:hypothetical protein